MRPQVAAERDFLHLSDLHPGDHDRGSGLESPNLVERGVELHAVGVPDREAAHADGEPRHGTQAGEDEQADGEIAGRRRLHGRYTPQSAVMK